MTTYTYPHTIDNGAGEQLTFLRRDGDRLEVENFVKPGSGPPMHVHHHQEEGLTIEQKRKLSRFMAEAEWDTCASLTVCAGDFLAAAR